MRRDKDVKARMSNNAPLFSRATRAAATKRPARFVAKKTHAAIAVLAILSSPAFAGPPYITDDPEPVDYQHWEFYAFSQGGRANGETGGVAPSCDCNYGVLPDVQLHIQPGAAFRRASGASPAWGPGNTELGLKYRFVEQDKTNATPSIAFYPLLEAPTGDPTRGNSARGELAPCCRSGAKRILATGRLLAAAVIGSIPVPAPRTIGSSAGSCNASSPSNWRSASSCSTKRRARSPAFNRRDSTSARSTISATLSPARLGRQRPQHARETNAFSWYIGLQITGVE